MDPMHYCHNTNLHFDIYSFLFKILQTVDYLLVLFSRVLSMPLPHQLRIGGIEKNHLAVWPISLAPSPEKGQS